MFYDRFDIVSAHYAFYCDFHEGQFSTFYARQCRISRYFTPSPMWRGFESLTENGQEIYVALCRKYNFAAPTEGIVYG